MKLGRFPKLVLVLCACSLFMSLASSRMQNSAGGATRPADAPKQEAPKQTDGPKLPLLGPEPSVAEIHQQMNKLIGEVELRMREIDKLLTKASAGEHGDKHVGQDSSQTDDGIGALVNRSREQGRSVVKSIDKILELANHEHPPGGT